MRRARPLLGTLVEVTVGDSKESRSTPAIEDAFAAVGRVHRLMSFHEAASDVSRLNRSAAREAVVVDPWTFAVLREALELSRMSDGAFDVTVATALVRWGLLPRSTSSVGRESAGSWTDIELCPGRRVRFGRPLAIDLGGIAKGFAVDQAIEALRAAGAPSGVVNAGGDLRVFGDRRHQVLVRHPASPGTLLPLFELRDEAVATSAPYFSTRRWRGRAVSPLVRPKTGRPVTGRVSVSVRASRCSVADSLTKVVLTGTDAAASALRAFGAEAVVLSGRAAPARHARE